MLADFSVLQTNSYSSSSDKTLHKLKVWMTIVESRWGVASGCGEQEAGVASGSGWNMGVATRCGCKEVYRFPHTTYPYSSCICSFLQQHPTFCSFKKMFFVL